MTETAEYDRETLVGVLETSRSWGFLGPGDVEAHIDHAIGYIDLIPSNSRVLDLGSGGGVPGLVLAVTRRDCRFTLLDTNVRRCTFLRTAMEDLELTTRVDVAEGRAEDLARDPHLRHSFDVVVARSFGAPAVLAECAVGFLNQSGSIVVSEPPERSANRWDVDGLATLGLEPGRMVVREHSSLQQLKAVSLCSEKYPRRNGVPSRKPLF